MRGSVKIGKVFGVPIRVHWSFSLLVLFVLYTGANAPRLELIWAFVWIVALFASVTLHELAHCAVARRHGLEVRDIVLLPIGGVSEIEGMNTSPRVERDVAAAGPAASVGLAIALAVVGLATGAHLWPPQLFSGNWLVRLAWLNLLLAGFNLVPALPMDGGRVFRAVLSQHRDEVSATRIATTVAQVLGVGMIALGIVDDLWLVLIGAFVLLGAQAERRQVALRASLKELRVRDLTASDHTTVSPLLTVSQLAPWLWAFPGRGVPVVYDGHYVGIVANEDLAGADPLAAVGGLSDREAPVLDPDEAVYPAAVQAFAITARNQLSVAHDGQIYGVVYRSTVEAAIRHTAGRPRAGAYVAPTS